MGVSKYSLKYSHHEDGTLDDLETYLPMFTKHTMTWQNSSSMLANFLVFYVLGGSIFVPLHTLCGLIVV